MSKNSEISKKFVIISGTPGTGKTTLAKKLSLLFKKDTINITDFCKKEGLFEDFDHISDTYDVDTDKMCSKLLNLAQNRSDITIIDGHLAHFLPPESVKTCIICTTELKTLQKRLKSRNYSEKKIKENLDSEIFEICLTEAMENGHKIIKIDTTDAFDNVISKNMAIFKEIFNN